MTTLAQLLASARILSGDGPSDNFARSENCSNNDGKADGTNLVFYVQNAPIAPLGVVQLMVDNTRIATPYSSASIASINEATGTIIFNTGHAPTTSVFSNYYYYLFPDSVWNEFVLAAMEMVNFVNSSSNSLDQDVQKVPDAFFGALKMLIKYWFDMRIAEQTGTWYNQRLQERVDDRDSISRKYTELASASLKSGLIALEAAYQGSGSNAAPSFRIKQFQARPWSPER